MASLRAEINKAVGTVFSKALGDIPRVCVYRAITPGSTGMDNYDIVTGVAATPGDDYTLQSVVFAKFKEDNPDADIQVSTDMRMLFARGALPVVPKTSDVVTDDISRKWEVKRVLSDPADAVAILHVRTT